LAVIDEQAIDRRKTENPDRPLIRISSTFVSSLLASDILIQQFWHLTPDHHLAAIPELQQAAVERFGEQQDYGDMLVGDQVRR